MNSKYLIILSILVLFYIFYNVYYSKNNQLNIFNESNIFDKQICNKLGYLDGYWTSNPEFNKLSDIDNMIFYIDYNNNNGYLLIISNNKLISKNEITMLIDENNIKFDDNIYSNLLFKCTFMNDDKNNFIWNNINFDCILSINNGNLKLFNNNILYADLYKDNMITSYINDIE